MDEQMTIGEAAEHGGVRPSTIRYYERVGVLPEPERVSGRRRYTREVVRRLAIIDVAKRAGFSLDEIRELFGAEGDASVSIRAVAERKLPAIDALIERAQAVRKWLDVASACECSTLDACALFDDRALGLPELPSAADGRDPLRLVSVAAR